MSDRRPYHHGNLRDALLDAAEQRIEDGGAEGLSMRSLARLVGVSHAAPQAHFGDRNALLDAVAQRGFERLGAALQASHGTGTEDFAARFTATMAAFVAFASEHAGLLELMFSRKLNGSSSTALQRAAGTALAVTPDFIAEGVATGVLAPIEPERYLSLVAAIARGVASLIIAGGIGTDAVPTLVADATETFLRGNAP